MYPYAESRFFRAAPHLVRWYRARLMRAWRCFLLAGGLAALTPACSFERPPLFEEDGAVPIDAGIDGEVPIDGMPAEPAMLVTEQGPHDFGGVTVAQQSGAIQVVVRNAGGSPSGSVTLAITGSHSADFAIVPTGDASNCAGVVLAPETTCLAQVRFQPSAAGARTARLEVAAAPGGAVTVDLSGTGLTPGNLTIDAGATLAFGTAEIASVSTAQTVTVRNTGQTTTGTLTTILGDTTNYSKLNDTCHDAALAANATCAVQVRFNPTVVGALPTQVTVRESPTVGISASATGTGSARLRLDKTGTGSVTSTPSGIACAAGCATQTISFTQSPVSLTAAAAAGHDFEAWGGACAGTQTTTCSVPLSQALTTAAVTFRALECTPSTTVCSNDRYVECSPTGTIDFAMDCPLGCAPAGVDKCLDVDPSNGLASYLDMAPGGPAITMGNWTINTTTGVVANEGGSAVTMPSALVNQPNSPIQIRVYWLDSLTIPAAATVIVTGDPALAFVVNRDVAIGGTLDVSGKGTSKGPGARTTGTCVGPDVTDEFRRGGGGGGRNTAGARGGNTSAGVLGGAGGNSAIGPTLVPLQGGCKGAIVTATSLGYGSPGGGGGGAVQIVSRTAVRITAGGSAAGVVNASAGGGRAGFSAALRGGAGGGGSGGGILLEAPLVLISGSGVVLATKGGGGGGVGSLAHGADGGTGAAAAAGGVNSTNPAGGSGGTATSGPTVGANANATYDAGGGGGGAVGETRINTPTGTHAPQDGAVIRSYSSVGVLGTRHSPP
jgi:hypothetical protein